MSKNTEVCRQIKNTADGRVTVIVYMRHSSDNIMYYTKALKANGIMYQGITAQIKLLPGQDERVAIDWVIKRTISKIEERRSSTQAIVDYIAAYATLTPEERRRLCPPEWSAASTRNAALAFFSKNGVRVIQMLLDCGATNESALAQAQSQIIEIVQSNQVARRSQGLSAQVLANLDAQARAVADQHVVNINKIYQASRQVLTGYRLPYIQIPRIAVGKIIPLEQCKVLGREVLVQLAALMWDDISSTPLSVGGILMMCCLLRPAETCPKYGEILDCGYYGVYAVLSQAGQGVRVVDLKTDAAYRLVVIPRYAMDAIRARRAELIRQGYSEKQITDAYIVSRDGDPFAVADPKELSGYVKDCLERLGCKQDYWAAVSLLMAAEPDTDEYGNRLADPTAYILRRSGCTYLVNCAAPPLAVGMEIPMYKLVDLIMGHALYGDDAATWSKWVRRDDNWPLIAQMMETVVLDPNHSAHPAFCLDPHDYGEQICHAHQRHVVGGGEHKITLQIRCHGTDEVTVRLPDHSQVSHRDQQVQSKYASIMPTIQEVLDPNYYLTNGKGRKKK